MRAVSLQSPLLTDSGPTVLAAVLTLLSVYLGHGQHPGLPQAVFSILHNFISTALMPRTLPFLNESQGDSFIDFSWA